MQKNFRIFKKHILIEAGSCVAILGVLLFGLQIDVFGLETRLPEQEKVVEAWVDLDYPVKYEGGDVAELLDIHAQIIAEKDETIQGIADRTIECYGAAFKYVLEDGSILARNYSMPIDMENPTNIEFASGKIIAREMEPQRFKEYLLGVNYESNRYLSGYISLYDQYQNYLEYRFSEDEIEVLMEALLKDIEAGNYVWYELYSINSSDVVSDELMNDINLRYYNEEGIVRIEDRYYDIPMTYDSGMGGYGGYAVEETVEVAFSSAVDSDNLYTRFGKRCTNVVAALEALGIINDTWKIYTHEEFDALQENIKQPSEQGL